MTLELDEDSTEYTDRWAVRDVLMKYFRFLPTPIYLEDAGTEITTEAKPINDTPPLWEKNPSDCTDDEYREFYHRVFPDPADPPLLGAPQYRLPVPLKGNPLLPKAEK